MSKKEEVKKRLTYEISFKKGVTLNCKEDIVKTIRNSTEIHLLKETDYNDNSKSLLIEIHYK